MLQYSHVNVSSLALKIVISQDEASKKKGNEFVQGTLIFENEHLRQLMAL